MTSPAHPEPHKALDNCQKVPDPRAFAVNQLQVDSQALACCSGESVQDFRLLDFWFTPSGPQAQITTSRNTKITTSEQPAIFPEPACARSACSGHRKNISPDVWEHRELHKMSELRRQSVKPRGNRRESCPSSSPQDAAPAVGARGFKTS